MLEPSIRLGLSVGEADSSLDMSDIRLELGFQSVSLSAHRNTLTESYVDQGQSITDKITTDKLLLNYRLRILDYFSAQVGAGKLYFSLTDSFDLSASVIQATGKWHSPIGFGAEYMFSTSLGEQIDIDEEEFTLFYGYDHFSVKGGFRSLKTQSMSLEGPFLGISMSF